MSNLETAEVKIAAYNAEDVIAFEAGCRGAMDIVFGGCDR